MHNFSDVHSTPYKQRLNVQRFTITSYQSISFNVLRLCIFSSVLYDAK